MTSETNFITKPICRESVRLISLLFTLSLSLVYSYFASTYDTCLVFTSRGILYALLSSYIDAIIFAPSSLADSKLSIASLHICRKRRQTLYAFFLLNFDILWKCIRCERHEFSTMNFSRKFFFGNLFRYEINESFEHSYTLFCSFQLFLRQKMPW